MLKLLRSVRMNFRFIRQESKIHAGFSVSPQTAASNSQNVWGIEKSLKFCVMVGKSTVCVANTDCLQF